MQDAAPYYIQPAAMKPGPSQFPPFTFSSSKRTRTDRLHSSFPDLHLHPLCRKNRENSPRRRTNQPTYNSMETRKGSTSTLRICIFLWFLLSLSRHLSAFSVTVNDIECVYEHVHHEGDTVSGNFAVVDHEIFWSSDHPGIDFEVTTPGGNVKRSLKGTSGDKFEFKAPKRGTYKFCFHNYYSTPKSVSFYIHIGHIPAEQDLAKDEHLDPINVKIAKLREALESITAEQQFLKARDSQHRHTNESTRWRLTLYTAAEYLALVAVSGLQVFYIRRLFNKSVAYNKM